MTPEQLKRALKDHEQETSFTQSIRAVVGVVIVFAVAIGLTLLICNL